MNDVLKSRLARLADDSVMIQALQTAFLERIEQEKPKISDSNDDVILGQKYRAYEQSQIILNKVLLDIQASKDLKPDEDLTNKGK